MGGSAIFVGGRWSELFRACQKLGKIITSNNNLYTNWYFNLKYRLVFEIPIDFFKSFVSVFITVRFFMFQILWRTFLMSPNVNFTTFSSALMESFTKRIPWCFENILQNYEIISTTEELISSIQLQLFSLLYIKKCFR
jgi:hypothetical protein